jgi:phosphoserine phosphatase
MQAMLRIAFRLGADLETTYVHVNNQLAEMLPSGRFITAFIGLLDTVRHSIRFHSGGQGPILHFRAASGDCASHMPTSFPLAALPIDSISPARTIELAPGDILAIISDGIFEYEDVRGAQFGEARVRQLLAEHRGRSMADLGAILFDAAKSFGGSAPQGDDMTVVLVKREP